MKIPRVPLPPLVTKTRGIKSCVDTGDTRMPISSRSQAAQDAHALAIIQWHTCDKLLYEAVTPEADAR